MSLAASAQVTACCIYHDECGWLASHSHTAHTPSPQTHHVKREPDNHPSTTPTVPTGIDPAADKRSGGVLSSEERLPRLKLELDEVMEDVKPAEPQLVEGTAAAAAQQGAQPKAEEGAAAERCPKYVVLLR